jgi:hypothetical protein
MGVTLNTTPETPSCWAVGRSIIWTVAELGPANSPPRAVGRSETMPAEVALVPASRTVVVAGFGQVTDRAW